MSIRFACAVMEEEKAWAVLRNLSGIVEIDLQSCKSRLLTRFEGKGILEDNLCGAIQKTGDYLAVAPMTGEEFYVYNLKNSSLLKYPFIGKQESKFWASFGWGKRMYFVGCRYPGIVKIDVEDKEIKVIEIDADYQAEISDVGIFGRSVGVFSDKAYIPVCGRNEDLVFDLGKEKYSFQKIGTVPHMAICGDGRYLCLVPEKDGSIEIYDTKKRVLKEEIKMPKGIRGMMLNRWFCTAVFHCGYAWIFPYRSNMILRLELNTGEIVCVKEFESVEDVKYSNAGVYGEHKIWCFYHSENRLDIIDCQSLSIESQFFLPPDNVESFLQSEDDLKPYMQQILIEESVNVKNLISYVRDIDLLHTSKAYCDECRDESVGFYPTKFTGIDIWRKICKKV